jgi:UDP-N-acetylglucosamine 2-epimerase (non-hydrolysing)
MKIAPILAELDAAKKPRLLVHTGQHYDARMSDSFFRDLGIPEPAYHLGVGSGTHAVQTARIMEAFEPVLMDARPSWVVVVGDVNSTLACALVASKLREATGCRIAHVEAGLRSNDWRMPEEVNRVLTDRLADLLLTPSEDATPNLLAEGINPKNIVFVGNVMIDTLFMQLERARRRNVAKRMGLTPGGYVAVTLHRPSNVDSRENLLPIIEGLHRVASDMPVVLPLHPRTQQAASSFGLDKALATLEVLEPLGYVDMLSLTDGAAVVLTDSGGLQEETTALGIPCVTIREQTERPATITHGTNVLLPWPPTGEGIYAAFQTARARGRNQNRRPNGWDGKAAKRIVAALT